MRVCERARVLAHARTRAISPVSNVKGTRERRPVRNEFAFVLQMDRAVERARCTSINVNVVLPRDQRVDSSTEPDERDWVIASPRDTRATYYRNPERKRTIRSVTCDCVTAEDASPIAEEEIATFAFFSLRVSQRSLVHLRMNRLE